MARTKLVFSCSLLAFCALVWGQADYAGVRRQLMGGDPEARAAVLADVAGNPAYDDGLRRTAANVIADGEVSQVESIGFLEEMRLREIAARGGSDSRPGKGVLQDSPEGSSPGKGVLQSPREAAKKIKSSPRFKDSGLEESNWLSRALSNLLEALIPKPKPEDQPTEDKGEPRDFSFLKLLAWILIGAAVVAFLTYVAASFRIASRVKRQKRAMLDEDEPERAKDEWLMLAGELKAQGKYREAVRCLYVACLLRMDELDIAQFRRHETNWEHLRRIEGSGKLRGIDSFREPTQEFDRIWYGMLVRGISDVEYFESIYTRLAEAV